ncbi:MAG: hypothetical protein H6657_00195, partial [Ardenticatenaceae bacterium]|nr:hypothetical protein [Ardenticatenaceae bacterium]
MNGEGFSLLPPSLTLDEFGFTLAPSETDMAFRLHGEERCLVYSLPDQSINQILGALAGDIVDREATSTKITVEVILGKPIKQVRLDWEASEGQGLSLPGFIKAEFEGGGRFSLILGAGDRDLSHVTLAYTFDDALSPLVFSSGFAWEREGSRELHNDADTGQAQPIFALTLTPKTAVTVILMEFNLASISLPTFLRQTDTPIQAIDLANTTTFCQPVPSTLPLIKDNWTALFTVNTDALKLPFLEGDSQFLSVDIPKKVEIPFDPLQMAINFPLKVKINFGDFKFQTEFEARFNLETFALMVKHNEGINLYLDGTKSESASFWGLDWTFHAAETDGHLFTLVTEHNNYQLILAEGAYLDLSFGAISKEPVIFRTKDFKLTPEGISLTTKVIDSPVRLNGLDTKFRFNGSGIVIERSQIQSFTIAGSGPLPPALVGEGIADINLQFDRRKNGSLTLVSGSATLRGSKMLDCKGTRFRFTIDALGIRFVNDGGFHLYFILTGSAQYALAPGDDVEGPLALLPNIKIDLVECPLTGDASVIAKHITFLIELPKPLSFNFLGCFEMELRAIGFVPQAPMFDNDGAMQLTGQVKFAQGLGDTPNSKHDYHKLFIGLPEEGSIIPRLYFERLSLNINMGAAFKMHGAVEFKDTETVKGFAGEGYLQIQGLPSMAVAMGFFRVRRSVTEPWVRAWFIYAELRGVSFMIPVISIYIREIGLGFGYRYTLVSIKAADEANDLKQLVAELKKLSRTQGNLSKIDSWALDLEQPGEDPRWTIVFRAMFSQSSAAPSPLTYDDAAEKKVPSVFLFDAVVAFRSDFTFFMAARGWINSNYSEFYNNVENMRERPFVSGYILLSPRQKRFLVHVSSNPEAYLGSSPPLPDFIQAAFRGVRFSATLLIEPGLLHYELGWPNMLGWDGSIGILRVQIRGGFIFRLSTRELVIGVNFLARGELDINVRFSAGAIGLSISAHASVAYGARYIGVLSFADFSDSAFYGAIGLELHIEISIRFWINFAFFTLKFKLSVGIHFAAALEIGISKSGPGLRGQAHVALMAMGHEIGFGVSIELNGDGVATALQMTEPFLHIGLEANDVESVPGLGEPGGFGGGGGQDLTAIAETKPGTTMAVASSPISAPNYTVFVVRDTEDGFCYFVLLPQAESESGLPGFLPVPPSPETEVAADFLLRIDDGQTQMVEQFNPFAANGNVWQQRNMTAENPEFSWQVNWQAPMIQDAVRFTEDTVPENGQAPFPGSEEITLHEFLSYAFRTNGSDELIDPVSLAMKSQLLSDDRVHNPTENAFEAAVRGAVEQFRGSPLFKHDPNYAYDQVLDAAYQKTNTIYNSSGSLSEDPADPERLEAEANQQAHQVRGMAIHDIVADLREYLELSSDKEREEFVETSLPFQMGLVFRVASESRPPWLDHVIRPEDEAEVPKIFQRVDPGAASPSAVQREVHAFNVLGTDFASNPPQFEKVRHFTDANTIAITWDLVWTQEPAAGCTACQAEPEHHLLHYRVTRQALDGQDRTVSYTVKTAQVLHLDAEGDEPVLKHLKPRFQIVDHFNHETAEEQATLPASGRSYLYSVVPVDYSGKTGRPLTLVATRYPDEPPLVPTDCELMINYRIAEETAQLPEDPSLGVPELIVPYQIEASWTEPTVVQSRPPVGIAKYRLIFRRQHTLPIGSYGLDSTTQGPRAKSLPSSNAIPRPTDIKIELNVSGSKARRTAVIQVADLQALNLFPGTDAAVWQPDAWQVFIQTESTNGVPSPLAPVKLMLRMENEAGVVDAEDRVILEREERQPAELEWLPQPMKLPLLPPEDLCGTPGNAHFPMPIFQGKQADLKFNGINTPIAYQSHPQGIRAIRFRWNQGPSAVSDYPLDLHAGYHLLELNIDAHTDDTFQDKEKLNEAVRLIQEVQMLPAADLLLEPGDTLASDQWEAWYPSAMQRRHLATEQVVEGNENIFSPWYSWRESFLVWPEWAGLTDDGVRNKPLHPFLEAFIEKLQQEQAGSPPYAYTVDMQLSRPYSAMTLSDFFASTAPDVDPYGWSILQRFGLSVTFALHEPLSGELIVGEQLLATIWTTLNQIKEQNEQAKTTAFNWEEIAKHLHVELLVQPGKSVNLERDEFSADSLLALVQVSLRPYPVQQRQYTRLAVRGPAGTACLLQFNLGQASTLINQADPAAGELLLEPNTEPVLFSFTLPVNGIATILLRSDAQFLSEYPVSNEVQTADNMVWFRANLPSGTTFSNPGALFEQYFAFQTSPQPHLIIKKSTSLLSGEERVELEKILPANAHGLLNLTMEFPTPFDPTDNLATYFLTPEDLSTQFAEADPYQEQWRRFKQYAESLNSSDKSAPQIEVPLVTDDIDPVLPDFLAWAQRFYTAGPSAVQNPAESISAAELTGPWLATAYPRSSSPAYAAPDDSGRLTYHHLLEDKWAHLFRYYIQPYGRYDRLWRSFRQSVTLFPERETSQAVPKMIPAEIDPNAGGLDIVVKRTKPVDKPTILRSGRLDGIIIPGRPNVPGKIWEVIIAQHHEQELMERNQTLARQLTYRQIAFTLLRRFALTDWWQTLLAWYEAETLASPNLIFMENAHPDIPQTYPANPDHLSFAPDALSDDDLYSLDLPLRLDKFQQGALVLQWEALPFYYLHRLMVIAQTDANVSPINVITQQDFGYRSPTPSALETAVDLSLNDSENPLTIRTRQLTLPLKRLWDSLLAESQTYWPAENPDAPSEGGWKPGALPDPEVIYQIVELTRGNVEVQAELFYEKEYNRFSVRQLGQQILVETPMLIKPPGSEERPTFYLRVPLRPALEWTLSQTYDLSGLDRRHIEQANKRLLIYGVFTKADRAYFYTLDEPSLTDADRAVIDDIYQFWFCQEAISQVPENLPEDLAQPVDFPDVDACTLVWTGTMDAADALGALPGDDAFLTAIQQLIRKAAENSESNVTIHKALLGPEQKPPGLPAGLDYQDLQWQGLAHDAVLKLLLDEAGGKYTSLHWHGPLYDDELERIKPHIQNWARVPELATGVAALFTALEETELLLPLPSRPAADDLPSELTGLLLFEPTESPSLLRWSGTLPTPGQQAALTTLSGDAAFNEALARLITQLAADVSVHLVPAVELPPLEDLPHALQNRLVIKQANGPSQLAWIGPTPNAEQAELLTNADTFSQDNRFLLAVDSLLEAIEAAKEVELPPLRRPTSAEIHPLLRDQLTIEPDGLIWHGRLHNSGQYHALQHLGKPNFDQDFNNAAIDLVAELENLAIDIEMSLPRRPYQSELDAALRQQLLIGRAALRYHGLMTKEEGKQLLALFPAGSLDQATVYRLYDCCLKKGGRNRQIQLRARRG